MKYRVVFDSMWSDDPDTEHFYRESGRPLEIELRVTFDDGGEVAEPLGFVEKGFSDGFPCFELFVDHPEYALPEDFPMWFHSASAAKAELREWARWLTEISGGREAAQNTMFSAAPRGLSWADYRERRASVARGTGSSDSPQPYVALAESAAEEREDEREKQPDLFG